MLLGSISANSTRYSPTSATAAPLKPPNFVSDDDPQEQDRTSSVLDRRHPPQLTTAGERPRIPGDRDPGAKKITNRILDLPAHGAPPNPRTPQKNAKEARRGLTPYRLPRVLVIIQKSTLHIIEVAPKAGTLA